MEFPPQIQKRLDAGMGCWSGIAPGWMPIVVELDEKLSAVAPNYTIDQIKEKFGGLRYYVGYPRDEDGNVDKATYDKMNELIGEAERKAAATCEECGEPGECRRGGWIRTLCDNCANKETE